MPGPAVTASDISARLQHARSVFETVDLFVAPSRSLSSEYARLGIDEARLEVSDYGFRLRPSAPRASRSTSVVFGFAGTIVWHKGVHVLVEAAARLSGDAAVLVYGDPAVSPEYVARLRHAAGARVRFMGPFEHDRLGDVYGAMDVLVVPSLWPENSPLVIHEAFMHGVPVVGARVGGIPDLIEDGVNGLLYDAESVDALARALQRFLDDRSLAGRLGSRAPALKSMASDAEAWERRYERVLAAPNRGATARGHPAPRGVVL